MISKLNTKQKLKELSPYLFLLIAVILFFPTIVFSGHTFISSGMVLSDLFLFNYPLKDLLHKSILNGQGIPLWTDLIGNGYPIFAEGQTGALYPFHLLFFSLPIPTMTAFNINLLLHYLFAGIFSYLYINKSIKLSKYASLLGAAIFMFSGYLLTHLHQVNIILVISYFPLNLYFIDRILQSSKEVLAQKIKIVWMILIGSILLYCQLTAGHIEMFYYNILFTFIYLIIRLIFDKDTRTNIILKLSVAVVSLSICFVLASPQLVATAELIKFSQRESGLSYEHTTGALWPFETLVLFINPKAYDVYRSEPGYSPNKNETVNIGALYAYVGLIPLVLVLIALISIFQKNNSGHLKKWTTIFLVIMCVTYVYAVGRSTQFFAVFWEITPGLKYFRFPIKAIYIIEFSLAVLSAIGLQKILEITISKARKTYQGVDTKNTQNKSNTLKKIEDSMHEKSGSRSNYAGKNILAVCGAVLIISFTYGDLWLNNRATQPTIPADDWLKTPEFAEYISQKMKEEQQAEGYVNWRNYSHGTNNIDYTRIFDFPLQKDLQNILHINFNMIHGIPLNREWAVLFLQRQTLLNKFNTSINFEKGELGISKEMKNSLDIQGVRFLVSDLPIIHSDIALTKTKTLSSPVDHVIFFANSTDSKFIKTSQLYLYENKTYVPRMQIIPTKNTLKMSPSDKQGSNILSYLLSPDFNLRNSLIIEDENAPPDPTIPEINEISPASTNVIKYTPQQLTIQTETDEESYLVIHDTYYPGWKATLDDVDSPIEKANYAFRAVKVPSGKHTVVLSFQQTYTTFVWPISLIGWGALAISLIVTIVMSKTKKAGYIPTSTQ